MQRNWFETGGNAYAQYRPDYPPALAVFLSALAPDHHLAVDVGCGNGQFTCDLAKHFDHVQGFDASADQLAHAVANARVRYACAPAEALGLADGVASLITVAQAAHWFDLPRFYSEVERVAVNGAVLALITYGIPQFEAPLNPRFQHFYAAEIGPFWPPERKHVDGGYAELEFPYAELEYPAIDIERNWNWQAFTGYLSTWSAMRKVEQAGQMAIVDRFLQDFEKLWGSATTVHAIRWPIRMRLARISK